jgi:hypothetical protein
MINDDFKNTFSAKNRAVWIQKAVFKKNIDHAICLSRKTPFFR